MDRMEMLKRIEAALIDSGKFADVMVSDNCDAVLFNDEDGNSWAITAEQF